MTGTSSGGGASMGVSNEVLLGELRGGLAGLEKLLNEERAYARASRATVHEKLDGFNQRLSGVESSVVGITKKVDRLEDTSATVKELTLKAEGAGWLGQRLLTLGGWIIGGAVALYQFGDWIIRLLSRAG